MLSPMSDRASGASYWLNGREAEAFAEAIPDPVERMLVSAALNHLYGSLLRNDAYTRRVSTEGPTFDALLFVEAVASFLRRTQAVRDILDGNVRSLEDLNSFRAT
jgi:hypothetical protein